MPRVTALAEDGDVGGVLEFPFEEKTILVHGREFTFRELSVLENDQSAEKARKPDDTIDGRLMMRFMVAAASVAPKLDVAALAKVPNKIYLQFATVVNDLNAPIEDEEKTEPKND